MANKTVELSVLNSIPDVDTAELVHTIFEVFDRQFPGIFENMADSTFGNLTAALDNAIGKKIEIIKNR